VKQRDLRQRREGDGDQDDQDRGGNDDADQAGDRAPGAAHAIADPDRHVGDVDAGQRLADRKSAQEFVLGEPAMPLHELPEQPAAEAAAKARQTDPGENQEELRRGRWTLRIFHAR
jgi:hypothetical protein